MSTVVVEEEDEPPKIVIVSHEDDVMKAADGEDAKDPKSLKFSPDSFVNAQLPELEYAALASEPAYTPREEIIDPLDNTHILGSRASTASAETLSPPHQYPPSPPNNVSALPGPATAGGAPDNAFQAYPEGGYGWVVTASAFVVIFQSAGILYTWGVLQAELAKLHLGSSVKMGLIGAVAAWGQSFFCLPAGWVLARLGPSKTAALGVTGMSIAMIGAGFCTRSYFGLLFFQGLMFGATTSMVYLPAYTIPAQFFMKRRGLTTGIASCGGGLGGAFWSIVVQKMIARLGVAWAYRIIGLCTLAMGLPAAYLLRPGYSPRRESLVDLVTEKGIFKSSRYIRILVACFVASYPFFIPPYYIPQYSQSVGMSASQGAAYSAIFNVASGVGRISFGLLADAVLGSINAWSSSLLVITLASLFIWPYATTQPVMMVFVCICGLGSGGFFSLQSSVISVIIGVHHLNRGISWVEVAQSFGYLAGPISAGALLDAFGGAYSGPSSYRPAMYLVGVTTFVAFGIIATVRWSTDRILLKRV